MSMRLLRIESLAELRRRADRWDDLWLRSEVATPTVRAELLAQWIERFAPQGRLAALVVEDAGTWVAALPLVCGGSGASRRIARVPRNCWSDGGELLLDAAAPAEPALARLIEGVRGLPASVVWSDGVDIASRAWETFLRLLRERRHRVAIRPQFDVGLIDIGDDWNVYEASLSGNHRRAVRKSQRKLEADHPLTLEIYHDASPAEATTLLRTVCEVEDKSWKGDAGTSILRVPGMFDFFAGQARQLAEWGQLEILLLKQNDRVLAAEYGFAAKGVYHSHKIAYDPEFRHAGPGRLLRALQLQCYFAERTHRVVDTLGILSDANAKWATRSRSVRRVVASTGGPVGQAAVLGYDRLWPLVKKFLKRGPASSHAAHDEEAG